MKRKRTKMKMKKRRPQQQKSQHQLKNLHPPKKRKRTMMSKWHLLKQRKKNQLRSTILSAKKWWQSKLMSLHSQKKLKSLLKTTPVAKSTAVQDAWLTLSAEARARHSAV